MRKWIVNPYAKQFGITNTKQQIVEERAENFVYIPVIQQEPSSFEEIVTLLS